MKRTKAQTAITIFRSMIRARLKTEKIKVKSKIFDGIGTVLGNEFIKNIVGKFHVPKVHQVGEIFIVAKKITAAGVVVKVVFAVRA